MKKLRGICLGAGYFSRFQYEAWARIPEVEIIALANRSLDRWMLREIFVPSRAFAVLATATLGLLAICVLVPFARSLFAFAPVTARDAGLAALAGLLLVGVADATKRLGRRVRTSPRR
jgi:hypothetical protein